MAMLPDAIEKAIKNGARTKVEKWLDEGGDPNARADVLDTGALTIAVSAGKKAIVELLLDAGAHANPASEEEDAPLVLAIMSGRLGIAQVLLDGGADLDQRDDLGATAAMWAYEAKAIDWLAKRGADLDATDEDGRTALHSAVSRSNIDVLAALLRHGASADIRDDDGQTPLEDARELDLAKVVAFLENGELPKPDPRVPRLEKTAADFARRLASGEFKEAAAMLAPALRKKNTPAKLRKKFEAMIPPEDGPPNHLEVMTAETDWPDRKRSDLGYAYVAIEVPGLSEAVTVTIREDGLIREIEWFRP